jgi:type II secretory pathway pseudopilin PulG
LEILLAIAILGGSLAILSQIAETGTDAAREARALAMARVLCQAKLSEVLLNATLGQTPTTVVDARAEPFDSLATTDFYYTVEVVPAPQEGLLAIRVSVQVADPDGGNALAKYQLTRWMIDPTLGLEELEAEEEAMREEASGGGGEEV